MVSKPRNLAFTACVLIVSALLIASSTASKQQVDADLLSELSQTIQKYQVLKPVNYSPPFRWAEFKGLYKSDIRINLVGDPVLQEIRNGELTTVFDNDMFSSGWIITALMEATLYGKGAPMLNASNLQLTLDAIGGYHNMNDPNFKNSLLRTFWPQLYNSTYRIWQQTPTNIRNVALNVEEIPWNAIENILKSLKLEKLVEICEEIQQLGEEGLESFSIPPDFDDTYLNLGIGATLYRLNGQYPTAYKSWLSSNTDIQHLFDVTSKYAYRPFDSDTNKNIIDPRTYFYAREFIDEAATKRQPVSLITTWIQNVEEQRKLKKESVSMPFNLNNVDVTVASNSIYGITSGSIYNINGVGDLFLKSPDMQQIYLNSTKFVSWAIHANLSSRPDLAQVYYPSRYNFLWYASRSLFLIESEQQRYLELLRSNDLIGNTAEGREKIAYVKRFSSLQSILDEAKSYLTAAFEHEATQYLLSSVYRDQDSKTYFCDFIGLNDTTLFGKPEQTKDDCLFSTAQAINIIIATWTYQDPSSKSLVFKAGTPKEVKQLLDSSVAWLKENVLGSKYKKLNAFFSGSVKGMDTLPFWYPVNYLQYLNGTFAPEADIPEKDLDLIIAGVSGHIDPQQYETLIKKSHFGFPTPVDFTGYNIKGNIFPFWSSEPYTYAVSLLALSQYNNLQ